MSGTVRTPAFLIGTDFVDNTTGAITAAMQRDFTESAFAMVVSPNGIKSAGYTAVLSDRGTIVPFNAISAVSYTIPANILPLNSVLGMLWLVGAAGQPAFLAGAGVTIANNASLTLRVAGAIGYAWQYSANTWYVLGDLT